MSVLMNSYAWLVCVLGYRIWFLFLISKFLKIRWCQLKEQTKSSLHSESLFKDQRMGRPSVATKGVGLGLAASSQQGRSTPSATHTHICITCWLLGTSKSSSPAKGWYLKYLPAHSGPATAPSEQTSTGKGSWMLVTVVHVNPFVAGPMAVQGSPKEGLNWWEQQGAQKDRCSWAEVQPCLYYSRVASRQNSWQSWFRVDFASLKKCS